MKRKIILISTLFFTLMLLFCLNSTVNAANVASATELQTELGGTAFATVTGNTVKLEDDVNLSTGTIFTGGTIILDLNGKTITGVFNGYLFMVNGADITITDTSDTPGTITNSHQLFDIASGKLTVEKGNMNAGLHIAYITDGELIINKGTFTSTSGSIVGVNPSDTENATLTINNGVFTAENNVVWSYGGNVTINDGTFTSTASTTIYLDADDSELTAEINGGEFYSESSDDSAIDIEGGNVTINDGLFEGQYSIYIDNDYNEYGENNKVIINDGTFTAVSECLSIDEYHDSSEFDLLIIINGGEFTSENEVALELDGCELEINGGTFRGENEYGAEIYAPVTIKGGDFIGYYCGIYSSEAASMILKGGRFEAIAEGEENFGGLCTDFEEDTDNSPVLSVANGYQIYEDDTITKKNDGDDDYLCSEPIVTVELIRYNITINTAEHGTISIGKEYAVKGETVTIVTTPDKNYKLNTIAVVTDDGDTVTATDGTFTMPEDNVTITATFKAEEKDSTPKTGTPNNIIYLVSIVTIISVAGISKIKFTK